ncbi:PspA/IM30 family protein [Aliikangiella maris]|uniref:PspA/IM30 family protein n=2 Tax=Aliikangiella maris TaxID=3162458 RepID=A0ABV3MJX8_9GAMM
MSFIKRLSIQLFSKLDDAVTELENHDALIGAAINQQKQKVFIAKKQQANLNLHINQIQETLHTTQKKQQQWHQRAQQQIVSDPEKAKECIHRQLQLTQQIEKLQQTLQAYQTAQAQLTADIQRFEQDIWQHQQKRDLLKTRQSRLSLQTSSQHEATGNIINDSFNRWEANIMATESNSINRLNSIDLVSAVNSDNHLEQSFLEAEYAEKIQAEFEQLIASQQAQYGANND